MAAGAEAVAVVELVEQAQRAGRGADALAQQPRASSGRCRRGRGRRAGGPGARGRRRRARGPRPRTGACSPRSASAARAADRDQHVDAVQQRAGEAAVVAGEVGGRAAAVVLPHAARARVRGGDEHEPRRERHHPLPADDRDVAVLERLAQRLQARAHELRQLVEEQHAVVGERRLARASDASRRRRGRTPRSCGAARGTAAPTTSPSPACRPATDWIRVTSIASAADSGGRIDGQPPGEHRLAGAGRAVQVEVVAAGRRDLERRDRARCGRARRRGRAPAAVLAGAGLGRLERRRRLCAAQDVDRLLERRGARAPAPRARARPRGRASAGAAAAAARGGGRPRRSPAPRGSARTSPVSDSSPTTAQPSTASDSSCPPATSSAIGERQVEPRADLAQVGRREVDRDPLAAGTRSPSSRSPPARARAPPGPPCRPARRR